MNQKMQHTAKSIVLMTLGMAICGCNFAKPIVARQNLIDSTTGAEGTAEVGGVVASKGTTYTYDSIDLQETIVFGDGIFLKKFTLTPQTLIARDEDTDWLYYFSSNMTVGDAVLGTTNRPGGIALSKRRKEANLFIGENHQRVSIKYPRFERTTTTAMDRPSFRQDLVYSGREGAVLKFVYRELSNDPMRGSLNQEIKHDLGRGATFQFKGATVKVIDATADKVRFLLLSNFPEPVAMAAPAEEFLPAETTSKASNPLSRTR